MYTWEQQFVFLSVILVMSVLMILTILCMTFDFHAAIYFYIIWLSFVWPSTSMQPYTFILFEFPLYDLRLPCSHILLYYLTFQYFDCKRTWSRFFQKCFVRTKLNIYVCFIIWQLALKSRRKCLYCFWSYDTRLRIFFSSKKFVRSDHDCFSVAQTTFPTTLSAYLSLFCCDNANNTLLRHLIAIFYLHICVSLGKFVLQYILTHTVKWHVYELMK